MFGWLTGRSPASDRPAGDKKRGPRRNAKKARRTRKRAAGFDKARKGRNAGPKGKEARRGDRHGRRSKAKVAAPAKAAPAPAPTAAPPAAAPKPKGINVYGFFAAPIGVGEAARRSFEALRLTGIPLGAHNIDLPHIAVRVPFPTDAPETPAYDTVLLHLNPTKWLRDAAGPLKDRRRIGYWHWELPVFPPQWMAHFAYVDEVWAPSRFIVDVIRAVTSRSVKLVPNPAVVQHVDRTAARNTLGLPQDRRIILASLDFPSSPARKNPDGALRAFRDAFQGRPDAPLLLIKYHRADPVKDAEQVARLRAAENVAVIDRTVSQEEMRGIYAASDAFLSLHRSEGFGLNILDMMALGKIAIATGFSGNLDFMTPENSLLVPWTMCALKPGDYHYGNGQWWAEPDHDAAVEALRFVASAPDSALAEIGRRAADDTLRDFSMERVAEISRAAWAG